MSTEQDIVSDAAFKAWPFSYDFNFAYKDGQVTEATCKYYRPLVVNPTITNCCKELHLKCGTVPRSIFENIAMHENYSISTIPVSHYLKMLPPLLKVIVFCSVTFYSMIKYF